MQHVLVRPTAIRSTARVDLFGAIAIVATLLLALALVAFERLDHEGFVRALKQEHSDLGAGVIEDLTFFVLLPGIACGAWAFARLCGRVSFRMAAWVLVWAAACTYFAGEEVSWGFWHFGWETPGAIAELNDQGETNLHNMSSWFDQKPRALVELFVFVSGVVLPLAHRKRGTTILRGDTAARWERWIAAPFALVPAAMLFVVVRISKYLPGITAKTFDDSELRELVTAWFLALYLIAYLVRAARMDQPDAGAADASLGASVEA